MNVLLLCGLGPTFRNKPLLRGSFLELGGVQTGRAFPAGLSADVDIDVPRGLLGGPTRASTDRASSRFALRLGPRTTMSCPSRLRSAASSTVSSRPYPTVP